jgi:ATP synthase protein I
MADERPHLDLKSIKEGTAIGAVGLEMGLSVIIGYAVGYYLDRWLGTSPVMAVIWTLFGLGAAAKALYVTYKKAKNIGLREQETDEEENPDQRV